MSYYIVIITPAIKYLQIVIPACLQQAGEGGNPGIHWMPDQVRHDGVSLFSVHP